MSMSPTPFEEALNIAGDGRYNYLLVITCAFLLLSISIDLFGFSLVVTAACDLNLDMGKKSGLLSLPFFGIFLTSYLCGYIADTRGRRYTLIRAMNIGCVLSISCSIAYNWIMLGVLKFLAVCFYSAGNASAYTLVGESCIARKRSRYAVMMSVLLVLSPAVSSGISYPTLYHSFEVDVPSLGLVLRPWRLLNLVLALPLGISGILISFFHESPKFLANWDRREEALQVIKKIHACNSRGRRGPFTVESIVLEDQREDKNLTFCNKIVEQGAPIFRKPLLRRTLQLYYIVGVIYLVNNSVVLWVPQMMKSFHAAISCETCPRGSFCSMLDSNHAKPAETPCKEKIEEIAIISLMTSQSVFATLTLVCSMFHHRRRVMLMVIFLSSASAALLAPVIPDPYVSIICVVGTSCTCLGMGIMASYFIDLYPTSYRGMVQCLSIMVARSSSFFGVFIVGNTIFAKCWVTFVILGSLSLSGMLASCFLPKDKPRT